jgi:hypothetical protein
MENYYVKFCYADDTYYSDNYDDYDLETLLRKINEFRFITLPNEKTIINLDYIVRIDIEKLSK